MILATVGVVPCALRHPMLLHRHGILQNAGAGSVKIPDAEPSGRDYGREPFKRQRIRILKHGHSIARGGHKFPRKLFRR
jgi:hypothetical protein